MLLKEMQMIKASDKNNNTSHSTNANGHPIQQQNQHAKLMSNSSALITSGVLNRFSLATSPSSVSSLSNNLQSYMLNSAKCVNSTSGTNTITNSPSNNNNNNNNNHSHHLNSYLSDLSNTAKPFNAVNGATASNSSNGLTHSLSNSENEVVGVGVMTSKTTGKAEVVELIDPLDDLVMNEPSKHDMNAGNNDEGNDLDEAGEGDDTGFKVKKSKKNSVSSSDSSSLTKPIKTASSPAAPVNGRKQRMMIESGNSSAAAVVRERTSAHLRKYAHEPEFAYMDFERADQSLKLEYYPWENMGFITAFSILPEMSELLDKNFKIATKMTYNT
jgi:hypothetical protein